MQKRSCPRQNFEDVSTSLKSKKKAPLLIRPRPNEAARSRWAFFQIQFRIARESTFKFIPDLKNLDR